MHARSVPALLVAAAFLAPAVAAGRVVHLTCRDGIAPSLPRCPVGCSRPVRCDADERCDYICTFAIRVCGEVACSDHLASAPVGQRQKIRLSTTLGATPTTFVLRCRSHPSGIPCPIPSTSTTTVTTTSSTTLPGAVTYTCRDALLVESSTDLVCDVDQACDDICTFGFHCPPWCGSAAPCFFSEAPYRIPVPVGARYMLPTCKRDGRPGLVLECQARPIGMVCPATTTTTLPVGSCVTDADCAIFPPVCQHCELGTCEGLPTINPNGSISGVVCAIRR